MAFAAELQDSPVVNEPVYYGARCHRVGEDLRPLLEGQIRRNCYAGPFVASRDDIEQQVRLLTFKWDVPQLVDKEQIEPLEPLELPLQHPIALGLDERHEQLCCRRKADAVTTHARSGTQRDEVVRLAGSGGTVENQVSVLPDKLAVEVLEQFRLR